jgi:hypothetical protein
MRDRKFDASGATFPFIPEAWLCQDSGFKPGSNDRRAGIAAAIYSLFAAIGFNGIISKFRYFL